jgi:hypothetical protein
VTAALQHLFTRLSRFDVIDRPPSFTSFLLFALIFLLPQGLGSVDFQLRIVWIRNGKKIIYLE